ncbi:small nuclear ribonucleoprotein G, putative [Cryptosporidium muris RN66]|uniref:Small nuclear ribonucleoprotein G n=2 Tax=Cryptosporidium TaxID=5806 RepID=B6AEW6_CRYMR|nr:small nuclear ribonucleoprotein G, putative [Cryptosporidium muris RN66]EEA06733.1 small nuclear ribonucleoprotein G, putative [Cryptosporidium muris RN66]|eukprot:XP_002141082.1 small nuclear ribonucleoprotein G [Cryptosporidium muris RN66]
MGIFKSGSPADLRRFMDKRLDIKLNGKRHIVGLLRGYDNFMNLVLENTVEVTSKGNKEIGTVIIRGNSVVMWECLDKVHIK